MSGVVQCFSVKKGEVVVSFKSLPGPQKVRISIGCLSWPGGACRSTSAHSLSICACCVFVWQVTAMVLGRSAKQRDKIFIAAGNTVGQRHQSQHRLCW
jgi:hypothetical protein